MKNEYLTRTATIAPENIRHLLKEVGEALMSRDDVALIETIGIGLTTRIVYAHLTRALFGDSEEAITLRGEDFAAKEMAIFRALWSCVDDVAEELKDDEPSSNVIGNTFRMIGTAAALLLGVEDKLFDSDHVEEHEAVKKEETNE
jgi:hypothetical protein